MGGTSAAATNIDLAEGADAHGGRRTSSRNNALLLRTPAALMPQLDRGVGADLVSTRGDVVGKRDDFKVWHSLPQPGPTLAPTPNHAFFS